MHRERAGKGKKQKKRKRYRERGIEGSKKLCIAAETSSNPS